MKFLKIILIALLGINVLIFVTFINSITGYHLSFWVFDSIQRTWFFLIFPVFVFSFLFLIIYHLKRTLIKADNTKWWSVAAALNLILSTFLVVQVICEISKYSQL